jgi:lipopolysaccharide biosynthesis protein
MALTISVDTAFGIPCANAHAVIREFRMTKEIDEDDVKTFVVSYGGLVWVDADKYADDASPIVGYNFQFNLDVTEEADQHNLLKQCYIHLKLQDDFTDGVDA